MMQYKGYLGSVEVDEEVGILHGTVIGIRDVITFQGNTVKQIKKAFHDSVDDYLAFCDERGEVPDKPYSGKFLIRTEPEVHRTISLIAEYQGVSLNTYVHNCLIQSIDENAERLISKKQKLKSRKASKT